MTATATASPTAVAAAAAVATAVATAAAAAATTATTITPEDNGPLHVQGPFRVTLPDGRVLERGDETWLCRCGASLDKPFCDDSHARIGFRATAADVSPERLARIRDLAPSTDADFRPAARSADVREGELLGVAVDGRPVVLGRVKGVVYAMDGLCSHQGAVLAEGDLDGPILSCPRHNGAFDIRTGAPARLPVERPICRYAVREVDAMVLVGPTV
jgi:nitrite reductase/ring-hydroxylating ferredoxin subunit/CDGSH-type Zn-finger protein